MASCLGNFNRIIRVVGAIYAHDTSPCWQVLVLILMNTSLFDIQVNGFAGVDFQNPKLTAADVRRTVAEMAAHQTLRFFATLITDSETSLCNKFENLERICMSDASIAAAICGYHLEGPWLSPEAGYHGAHDAKHMTPPDIKSFRRLQQAAGGNIRLVTLAPELPGSARFIRAVTQVGVHVSLGHTAASDADIDRAIASGARFCTHLGNGVPQELHRHNNVMQRLLARDELTAFFIPDGIHLPPPVLKNFFRAKPAGQALFTTDCMAAAGAPAGRYTLGDLSLEVGRDGIVRQPGRQNFAGSALCPDEGVRNIEAWLGLNPTTARRLFSTAVADHFKIKLPTMPKSS
jgi:N-acetylglucosamine-6-phosphate deacetylase